MKFTGPYSVGHTGGKNPTAYVVGSGDGDPNWIICWATKLNDRPIGEQLRDMRRIAAALNRDDARKATKTKLWDASCARDGWNFDITFNGEIVSHLDVAALLNKLGVTLPKRRPAWKGSR